MQAPPVPSGTPAPAGSASVSSDLEPSAIQQLAQQGWPGTTPVAVLRKCAVNALLKSTGPAGQYSMPASVFRQVLQSTGDAWAWQNCPSFEGSKVKSVLVGAEIVFKAKYVPGETSKAVVLDVEGLQELAADPTKSTEWTPPNAPPLPPQPAPGTVINSHIPSFAPAPHPQQHQPHQQHNKGHKAPVHPLPPQPGEIMPSNQELSICMMAMAVYRGSGNGDSLATLRCKLACLLSRMPDAPMGPHTMLGTHLGDALGKLAPEAWQALPSAGSRLQRLADPPCLLVEQHPGGVCMRLDVPELQKAATQAALQEWRSFGPAAGVSKKLANHMQPQDMSLGGLGIAAPAPAAGPPMLLPSGLGLDPSGNLPHPREDDYGLALASACITVWGQTRWHLAAATMAMLGQPGGVAQRNGGRHCSHVGFFIKEVQRVAAAARVPASELTTKHIAASEPLLSFGGGGGAAGGIVSLRLRQLAQAALAAAAPGTADAPGGAAAGMRWPPDVQDLPIGQLHQQAQPLVRQLVQVLSGADGPEARAALLMRCMRQFETLVGPVPTPTHANAAPQQPGSATSAAAFAQNARGVAGGPGQLGGIPPSPAGMILGMQQGQAVLQGQAVQGGQPQGMPMHPGMAMQMKQMLPPGSIIGQPGMLSAAGMAALQAAAHAQQQQRQQQQQQQGGLVANHGNLQSMQIMQMGQAQQIMAAAAHAARGPGPTSNLVHGATGELQQRLVQLVSAAYPVFDPTSVLRRLAVLSLAVMPQGPVGPHSMLLKEMCSLLCSEEPKAWQDCFGAQPESQMLRDTITLLHGAPGFVLQPTYEVAVQLDLGSLERAALASGAAGMTMQQV